MKIVIGRINSPHGVRGQLKIESFTDPFEKIFDYKTLYNQSGEILAIKKIGVLKNQFICSIEGTRDRNEAEDLKGQMIYIDQNELVDQDDEDEFYIESLKGLNVKDADTGDFIGIINNVVNYGAGDIIEIKGDTNEIMLPFAKKIFIEINLDDGYVIVQKPNFI